MSDVSGVSGFGTQLNVKKWVVGTWVVSVECQDLGQLNDKKGVVGAWVVSVECQDLGQLNVKKGVVGA